MLRNSCDVHTISIGEHLIRKGRDSCGFASGDLGALSLLVVPVPLPQSTVDTPLSHTHTHAHTHTHTSVRVHTYTCAL